MALNDADRRRFEALERQLQQEDPRLARVLRREPARLPRLQALPVLTAAALLLVSCGWLAVQGGTALPLLIAAPVAAVGPLVLWWQRTESAAQARGGPAVPAADEQRPEGPPPWWFT